MSVLNSIRARALSFYKKADNKQWPNGGAGADADALLLGPHRIFYI